MFTALNNKKLIHVEKYYKENAYASPSKSVSFRQVYVSYSHKYMYNHGELQYLKAYRIKFQKFAAHAHKDALINETYIPT